MTNGCSNCDAETWSTPYELENGLIVMACDECNRAEIVHDSVEGLELHEAEVYRDDKGRFVSGDYND